MNYIDDAGKLWHKFWSNRLSMLSSALSAANVGVMLIVRPPVSLRVGAAVAVLSLAASMAAVYARQVAQRKLRSPDADPDA